jgi:hypothetical protein
MNVSAPWPFSIHKEAKMRKTLTAALAALTLGGAISATAVTSAEARPYAHAYYGGHYHHGNGGAAVAAGIAGLAIGAAIASPHYYGGGPYYGPAYYGPGYYGTCYATRWVWDPYAGRRVPVSQPYAC